MEDSQKEVLGHSCRILTEKEIAKLKKDCVLVPEFKQLKFEAEARKYWDKFYNRNSTNFFKDRHWTKREFSELDSLSDKDGERKVILEVGCGVGNFIFPLIEEGSNAFFYACDFSKRAVDYVKKNSLYNPEKCKAFECDITQDDLTGEIPENSVDFVTLIFVLSAIHPDKMIAALENIFKVLKPGGCILFRDYGLYDYAMLRFSSGHKLAENFYVRQDGTRAFYFSLEYIAELAANVGYELIYNNYVQRDTVNKKEGICVPRIFVQSKWKKTTEKRKSDVTSSNNGAKNCECSSDNGTSVITDMKHLSLTETHLEQSSQEDDPHPVQNLDKEPS